MNEIKSDICQGGPTAPDVYLVGNEPGQSFGPNYPAPQGRGGGGGGRDILAYTHVQEMHVATRALQGILRLILHKLAEFGFVWVLRGAHVVREGRLF